MKTDWRESAEVREVIGKEAEHLFMDRFRCSCGGRFTFIGNLRPGFPDCTCDYCGQLVDIKVSPQAERTGNISVSAIPWDNYPEEMLLVTCIAGKWLGEYKANIRPINGRANEPTHHENHARLHDTRWYLISWKNFPSLDRIGLQDTSM